MSEWPRVITDKFGDTISVEVSTAGVYVEITEGDEKTGVVLSTDQCAAVIAAITDAAKRIAAGNDNS